MIGARVLILERSYTLGGTSITSDLMGVLRSFDQRYETNNANQVRIESDMTRLQQELEEALNAPLSTTGNLNIVATSSRNLLDKAFSKEMIFGFNTSQPGDSW